MSDAGALRFARYAVPPHVRGYCGPPPHGELAAYGSGLAPVDGGLCELARGFAGAWPYLELLAGAGGIDDPLDDRVVEAYWIGNALCQRVGTSDWGWHLVDRFGARAGVGTGQLVAGVGNGALPNHAFHVLCVSPWVGLLREGRGGDEPLRIVRECHISWGMVRAVIGEELVIEGPRIRWDRDKLALTEATKRVVHAGGLPSGLRDTVLPGCVVAVHWDQAVDVLEARQLARLSAITRSQIAVANRTGLPTA